MAHSSLQAAQDDQPRGMAGKGALCNPLWDWAFHPLVPCPGRANNATPFILHLFQNGSKDTSLDMLGTDIWAANTFDSFR